MFSSLKVMRKEEISIKLETTLVHGYFYTACSVRSRPFCIFIRCEACKWRSPLRLHYGIYGKPLEYKLYCYSSIRDYVGSQCRENETTAGYHGQLQQSSSIVMSVNEWKPFIKAMVEPFRKKQQYEITSIHKVSMFLCLSWPHTLYAWITIHGDFLQCIHLHL